MLSAAKVEVYCTVWGTLAPMTTYRKDTQTVILVDETIRVRRPLSAVFAYICNHENYAQWFPEVDTIVSGNDLPHGTVGKQYREAVKVQRDRTANMTITVVASIPNEFFATEGDFVPLLPSMEVRFTPVSSEETQVQWRFLSRNRSLITRFAITLIAKRGLQRRSKIGLQRLKKILEA
jgi:hypothetical protein